ncbi:uncharacterized protein LOC120330638 isoform X2 [Styela clava]
MQLMNFWIFFFFLRQVQSDCSSPSNIANGKNMISADTNYFWNKCSWNFNLPGATALYLQVTEIRLNSYIFVKYCSAKLYFNKEELNNCKNDDNFCVLYTSSSSCRISSTAFSTCHHRRETSNILVKLDGAGLLKMSYQFLPCVQDTTTNTIVNKTSVVYPTSSPETTDDAAIATTTTNRTSGDNSSVSPTYIIRDMSSLTPPIDGENITSTTMIMPQTTYWNVRQTSRNIMPATSDKDPTRNDSKINLEILIPIAIILSLVLIVSATVLLFYCRKNSTKTMFGGSDTAVVDCNIDQTNSNNRASGMIDNIIYATSTNDIASDHPETVDNILYMTSEQVVKSEYKKTSENTSGVQPEYATVNKILKPGNEEEKKLKECANEENSKTSSNMHLYAVVQKGT